MRREASHFGRLFWFRPLLIEILFPVFLVWLYQFEMAGGLLSDGPMQAIVTSSTRTVQFVIHGVLIFSAGGYLHRF